jgi:hypothetical protein
MTAPKTIQIVGYWEDASEFPFGPYVAVPSPAGLGYRIERARADGKPGTTMCNHEPYPHGWKTLEEITLMIEELNRR